MEDFLLTLSLFDNTQSRVNFITENKSMQNFHKIHHTFTQCYCTEWLICISVWCCVIYLYIVCWFVVIQIVKIVPTSIESGGDLFILPGQMYYPPPSHTDAGIELDTKLHHCGNGYTHATSCSPQLNIITLCHLYTINIHPELRSLSLVETVTCRPISGGDINFSGGTERG